jgi:hypothetical protein
MRSALVDRYRVKDPTLAALVRRGLAVAHDPVGHGDGGCPITLTEAGRAARDAILAPFAPGVRVRNTLSGLVGTVVLAERGERCDVVTLRWDDWGSDTSGSPAYLEVLEPDTAKAYLAGDVPLEEYLPDAPSAGDEDGTTEISRAMHSVGIEGASVDGAAVSEATRPEVMTIVVPRALADRVAAAWDEAYQAGSHQQAERFRALAEAYSDLRDALTAYADCRWLSRALLDASADAEHLAGR